MRQPPTQPVSTRHRGALLALLLGAAALRLLPLNRSGLSGDEAFTAWLAAQGPVAILAATRSGEPHPPLFYLLAWGWWTLAGPTEVALRLPSALLSLLTVALVYRLGATLFARPVGWLAAGFLALQPYHVWYAGEARMYSLLAAASALTLVAFSHLWWSGRTSAAAATVFSTTVALYTHYYGLFLPVIQGAVLLVHGPGAWPWRRWAGLGLLVGLLYLPWPLAAWSIVGGYNALGPTPLPTAVRELLLASTVGLLRPADLALGPAAGLALLALGGLWSLRRARPPAPLLLGGGLLLPLLVVPLVSLWRPVFATRCFLVTAPVLALCIGAGLARIWRWPGPGLLLTLGTAGALGWGLWPLLTTTAGLKSGYRDLAAYLHRHARATEAIILAGHSQQFQFWYDYRQRQGGTLPAFLLPSEGPRAGAVSVREVTQLRQRYPGLWLIDTDTLRYDPERRIERTLVQQTYRVLERLFLHNRLLYTRSFPDPPAIPLERDLGPLRLRAIGLGTTTARPGEVVPLWLDWTARSSPLPRLKVSLRLVNPDGHLVQTVDGEPLAGFQPTPTWEPGQTVRDRYGFLVPATAPPGPYRFFVVLYEATSGQPVGPAGLGVELASLTVAGPPLTDLADLPSDPPLADLGGLRLRGWSGPTGPQPVGAATTLTFLWERAVTLPASPPLTLEWRSADGQVHTRQTFTPSPSWSPITAWPVDWPVAVPIRLTIPPRLPTGPVTLWLVAADGQAVRLGDLQVQAPARSFTPPRPQHPVDEIFGGVARLVGIDLEPPVPLRPSASLRLVLYWQAVGETDRRYKIFLHLVGPDGRLHGQRDLWPGDGARPTTSWLVGEFLRDALTLTVAADAPPGRYRLLVGLYDEETGQRLRTATGADAVTLAHLEVAHDER